MAILLHTDRNFDLWIDGFARALPEQSVHLWPDVADPTEVEYLVTWLHDWSDLATYPNLRAILLVSAGIDHVDFDAIPSHLPVVRLVDPAMSADIAEYCRYWVTHFSRSFDTYRVQQASADWVPAFRNQRETVGILGLGAIGTVVGNELTAQGHPVISWSRSEKDTTFGRHHVGPEQLGPFLEASDVVVNLLPLSDATTGLVDDAAFAALGGGVMINVGRGATIDEAALLRALDGSLRGAVLDVFPIEPLPADSPLWHHPKVVVTPHVAGETNPISAAAIISDNIRRIERGEAPSPIVTRTTY